MSDEITYQQAEESTDIETLVQYCKQGAIDAEHSHRGKRSDWRDGEHLVESYLDHNTVADTKTLEAVAKELDVWLQDRNPIRTYSIVFRDNAGSRAVEAIADGCGGSWRNSVQSYDGKHDLAFVDVPNDNAETLEQMLDEDENVVSYEER